MLNWRSTCVGAALATGLVCGPIATPAGAQTPTPPAAAAPRWYVSAGGAFMNPLHGDDEDEGRVVLAAVGITDDRHVRVEAEVTRRAKQFAYPVENEFLYGGPNGIHGRADRTVLGHDNVDWTVGVNVFGQMRKGALSLYGGPGLIIHREHRRRYRTVTNCTPPVPSFGLECAEFDTRESTMSAGLQLMVGVDLAVHRRVAAFVAGRGEYRNGLAMGGVGVAAGLRIGVW